MSGAQDPCSDQSSGRFQGVLLLKSHGRRNLKIGEEFEKNGGGAGADQANPVS